MASIADRMMALFRGFEGGHGTYGAEERAAGRKKTEIKKSARTLREPVTTELWEQHLDGKRPLGVIPITLSGDCWWGVIDVDIYDLSHVQIQKKVESLSLPMQVCRSKSGGAHLFLFLREAAPAAELIEKLREFSASLGFGGSEIFPKQTEILVSRGDLGNWLNMPYFDADRGTRCAIDSEGRQMSVEKFLDRMEQMRITLKEFRILRAGRASDDKDLEDGPPCLQYLAETRVAEGGRNNALFAFGTLAKKKYPDEWEARLDDWNRRFVDPPLPNQEVGLITRSLRRKDYEYRCKDQPICNHCDAQVCRSRKFGIGPAGSSPPITSISILETTPPLFFVCMASGGTIECSSDDILTSRAFQRAVLEQMRLLVPLYKQDVWLPHLQSCLDKASLVEAPPELGTSGTFKDHVEQFCTDMYRAQEKDEMLLGKPWLDEETGRYYLRMTDLMSHLEKNKFRLYTRAQAASRLREMGGNSHFFNLRGRGVNCWWIPREAVESQSEPLDTPRAKGIAL